jgi:hypothetical protein
MLKNNDLMKGVAIGFGAAILVPVALATLVPVLKPVVRSTLKTGIRVYEKGREAVEELGESFDDLVAEVEEEIMEARESSFAAEAENLRETVDESKSADG